MNRVLHGENLPKALSLSNTGISNKAILELSTVGILGLFVSFGSDNFRKGPAVLLTEGIHDLRQEELLTMIAITHGKLGE